MHWILLIVQLINKSPKRKHLFSEKLTNHESVHKGIKPLCPTRWTVRAEALDAVLKQYKVIIETMKKYIQPLMMNMG